MDRLPRDQSLHTRLEHKKAQVKSQLDPAQHHLIDDLVDFVVEQMDQSRDVVTVSSQSRRHETQSTATTDPNCSSREQSIPQVVSTLQPQSSLQSTHNDICIKQEEPNFDGQTTVLFGPIKTEFESSSSSGESNSAVPIKQELKEEIKEELEEKIVEHSDDDECDCSECELEVKRKVGSEGDDDDDQPNTERAVKRQRKDEQMNVQVGMVRSNGGDGGGEGDLNGGEQVGGGELIDEQMMDDDDNLASTNGPSSQGRTLRSTEPTPTQPPTTFEPNITETEHCVKTVFKSQWSRRSTSTTYQCRNYGDCTLVTKNLNHFRIHQRTHSGVKPFKCSVSGCEFAAGVKGTVRDHVKKVHFPNLKKDSTFYDRYIETDEQLLNSNTT